MSVFRERSLFDCASEGGALNEVHVDFVIDLCGGWRGVLREVIAMYVV